MSEKTILWQCPKCSRFQNRILRFKDVLLVSEKEIHDKLNKLKLQCKYCHYQVKCRELDNKRYKVLNPQDTKFVTGELNKNVIKEKMGLLD